MKKWIWLAAFYVVEPYHEFYEVRHSSTTAIVVSEKYMAEDLAFALNEAHERKRRNNETWIVLPMDVVKRSSQTFRLYDDMVPVGAYRK